MSNVTSAAAFDFDATSRRVDAGPYSLHYHDAGTGPALLMLHGSGPGVSGWSNFRGNLPVLAQHFRVLILDQPGFGLSPKPTLDQNYIVIAADAVRAFLDALAIERTSIVGNSMGGGVATRFTLDHPVRVEKLILMGPGGVASAFSAQSHPKGCVSCSLSIKTRPARGWRHGFARWCRTRSSSPTSCSKSAWPT